MPNGTTPTWIAAVGLALMPWRSISGRVKRLEEEQQDLKVEIAGRLASIETSLEALKNEGN